MDNYNILIVDDEKKIVDTIEAYLLKDGYNVFKAYNGKDALEIFENEDINLLILDLMLPYFSGEEVCSKIRAKSDIPIIMLTAKNNEDSKIEGLSIGADDYVTKPFSARELVARVKVQLRRNYKDVKLMAEKFIINNGELEIDFEKQEVLKNKQPIKLTSYEFKLLKALTAYPGKIFTREELLDRVMGDNVESFDRSIDTHIRNLRKKIEEDSKAPKYILTVYGAGYKFGGFND
ncbi:response regulator [Clostridium sp. DL1XJH146]